MSVQSRQATVSYTGTGTTPTYAYPFKVTDAAQLEVLLDGVPTTAFTYTGIGNIVGGTINLTGGNLGVGVVLTISRVVDVGVQPITLRRQGDLDTTVLEDALDLLTFQVIHLLNLLGAVYTTATLPPASSGLSGLAILRDPGAPDQLLRAIRNSDGTYQWAVLTTGS